jgi:hypothetical protein
LLRLYEFSFSNEYHKENDFSKLEELRQLTEKSFFVFCYDFNIIPQFLERGMAQSILEELLALPLDTIQNELVTPDYQSNSTLTWKKASCLPLADSSDF